MPRRPCAVLLLLALGGCRGAALDAAPDIAAWADVLTAHVDAAGRVDYAGLQQDPAALRRYLESVAELDPAVVRGYDDAPRIAFWINVYNALVLQTIVERLDLAPGPGKPAPTIRAIEGVFDRLTHRVAGTARTLDDIEHDVLRARFAEPRIHVALVCGARSCPPLRAEPYRGGALDDQLTDQARRYLAGPPGLAVVWEERTIRLSRIFEWFGGDFATGRDAGGFADRPASLRPVLAFVSRHVGADVARRLADPAWRISFAEYDWSLNGQQRPPAPDRDG